jgi:hypothetical protein
MGTSRIKGDMMDRTKGDMLRIVGNILLILGVAVWAVYAVLRFGAGWDVRAGRFLPFHLAGVIPGAILRRHRFFRNIFSRFR